MAPILQSNLDMDVQSKFEWDDEISLLVVEEEPTGLYNSIPAKPAATVRDLATLTTLVGYEAGKVVSVDGEVFLGRSPQTDVCIQDHSVSRTHARIVRHGTGWTIEDLGSRNGTFVNGGIVRKAHLSNGDYIQLGASAPYCFELKDREEADALRRIYEASVKDGLTGALNRHHFDERLDSEVAFALRHSTEIGLILFDIDHFKRVNDRYGHPAGDAVLKNLATAVDRELRAEDVLARYGGEEFAIIARATPLPGLRALSERIRASVSRVKTHIPEATIEITISVGFATLSSLRAGASSGALIRLADEYLYAAKRSGRDRVVGPTVAA